MKRDRRLHPLSWGHHPALSLAHRLRKALLGTDPPPLERISAEFCAFWQEALSPHLRAEEEILLPAVSRHCPHLSLECGTILEEHRRLVTSTERVSAGGGKGPFLPLLDLLIQHIRFEERVFFPLVEAGLPPAHFDAVGEALAERLPGRRCGWKTS
ncbi:MAG: hemerythrin domain-containing protein [Deltaproteobacteria bacterium]|nr:MAG: hemerythrin domain-containing protein [Deltaproteobacteria bacterium]